MNISVNVGLINITDANILKIVVITINAICLLALLIGAGRLRGYVPLKLCLCASVYLLISSLAYDTHMYHHLFNIGGMDVNGIAWDYIGMIVKSYEEVLLLYLFVGALLTASVYYYFRGESKQDAYVYLSLTLPACLLEYTGLLRQGVSFSMMAISLRLYHDRRYLLAVASVVLGIIIHPSLAAAYCLVSLAFIFTSKMSIRNRLAFTVSFIVLLYLIDMILNKFNIDFVFTRIASYFVNYVRDKEIQGDFGYKLAFGWCTLAIIGLCAPTSSRLVIFGRAVCIVILIFYPILVSISGLAARVLWYVIPFSIPAIDAGIQRITKLNWGINIFMIIALGMFAYYIYLSNQSEFVPIVL